jgi:hypothetical protein
MLLKDCVKFSAYLLFLLCLYSCDYWGKTEKELPKDHKQFDDSLASAKDTVQFVPLPINKVDEENKKIIEKIRKLPECKRLEEIVKKKPDSKIDYQIVSRPSDKDPNYYIKILEKNNNDIYVKMQIFVNSKNDSILIYDPGEDRLLSLDEWRKLENQ